MPHQREEIMGGKKGEKQQEIEAAMGSTL